MCLQSWPLAGNVMRLNEIGQSSEIWKRSNNHTCAKKKNQYICLFYGNHSIEIEMNDGVFTLSDVCSIDASFSLVIDWLELKLRFILATQWSTGTKLRRSRLCNTCLMVGRWTSCNTNRCDCMKKRESKGRGTEWWVQIGDKSTDGDRHAWEVLTQQHALTVIWIVFRPGWQTRFRYSGRCELLFSPRSMASGVAFADTWTLAGQLVFIWRSSWWKHFSCNSKSDLREKWWEQNQLRNYETSRNFDDIWMKGVSKMKWPNWTSKTDVLNLNIA